MPKVKRFKGDPPPEGSNKHREVDVPTLFCGTLEGCNSLSEVGGMEDVPAALDSRLAGYDVVLLNVRKSYDYCALAIFLRDGSLRYLATTDSCLCTSCIGHGFGEAISVAKLREMLANGELEEYVEGCEEEVGAVLDMLSSLGYP